MPKSRPSGSWSPWQNSLPRLPEWGSPNGWDYWGRPWAYMGAPNRHPDLKVKSSYHKHAARVTIAVLVNCEREPQYFPNLDVAKSAAATPTWRGHTARVIDGSGILNPKLTVAIAARKVQPPHYEGSNVAVESLFGIWDSFRTSKMMWRPNPEMPRGDVMLEGCRRALTADQLTEHRPVNSVPPTRPVNPTVKPAAPHVDQAAFPALPPSSHEGIGGIPGTREFPLGTTEGFGAFGKPDPNTVVPRAVPSATSVPSSPMTTATVTSPAVTQAVATTATATTLATSAPAVIGKPNLEPKVSVLRLSPEILESARAKLVAKADPNRSGQGKASSKGSSAEEPMDCEGSHVSRDRSTSHIRTHRSRSQSTHGDKDRKGAEGKTSSTPKASGSKESDKKSGHTGPVAVSEMLLKAGGAKALGKSVGPIPRHSHDREYRVDYSREPCPAPAFQLDQPRGSHLEGSHDEPKSTWHADPRMSLATLQDNLQAIAQAGSRHALYRSQQGMLRTRSEAFHVWERSNEAFRHIAHESVFLDEAVAGNVMATHHELQRCNTALKADLKVARRSVETARQNTKDALKTTEIQDKRVTALTSDLAAAVDARDKALAEIEQLKAAHQQLLNSTGQEAAEAGMAELKRQLDQANQQLANQGSVGSVHALTERCKELEDKLQLSNERLRETMEASGLSQLQTRLETIAGERDRALKREQELLAEGRKLEAQYNELKLQQATTKAELESELKVARIELESKQKQYEREAEFAQSQQAEVDRLRSDLKEVRDELKAKKAELANLQASTPPVPTMAQFLTMPPGQPY